MVPSMFVRDHRADVVGAGVDDVRRGVRDAGVVDPEVHPAERGDGRVPERLHLGRVGDVRRVTDHPGRGPGGQRRDRAVHGGRVRPLTTTSWPRAWQLPRQGPTDPLGAAGDDDGLALVVLMTAPGWRWDRASTRRACRATASSTIRPRASTAIPAPAASKAASSARAAPTSAVARGEDLVGDRDLGRVDAGPADEAEPGQRRGRRPGTRRGRGSPSRPARSAARCRRRRTPPRRAERT